MSAESTPIWTVLTIVNPKAYSECQREGGKPVTTAIAFQVRGVDITDEDHMDILDENFPEYVFARRNGITTMTVFADKKVVAAGIDAIRKVEALAPEITVERVYADLVTMPQIGERIGLTREAIRKWTHQESFPQPLGITNSGARGEAKVWAWAEIVQWMKAHKAYQPALDLPAKDDTAAINAHIHLVHQKPQAARVFVPTGYTSTLTTTRRQRPEPDSITANTRLAVKTLVDA